MRSSSKWFRAPCQSSTPVEEKKTTLSSGHERSVARRLFVALVSVVDSKCQTLFAASRVNAGCRVEILAASTSSLGAVARRRYIFSPALRKSAIATSLSTVRSPSDGIEQPRTARFPKNSRSSSTLRVPGSRSMVRQTMSSYGVDGDHSVGSGKQTAKTRPAETRSRAATSRCSTSGAWSPSSTQQMTRPTVTT